MQLRDGWAALGSCVWAQVAQHVNRNEKHFVNVSFLSGG